jgi:flavorubredoxin
VDIPIRFLPTQTVAPETFLIRQLAGEGMGPVAAMLNSLVIRGTEPVIVDTGASVTSGQWLEEAFSLVDPADVRWVFLSHDDTDHTGSLFEVLDRCPRATLVTNWFTVERMAADRLLPLERLRLVNPGESFPAGDRTLTAVVPPVYDSPTTRGLHDSATGVYWAADAFATYVPGQVDDVADLPPGFFREGFLQAQRMVSPWHNLVDPAKYEAHLDTVRSLDASVAVGAHGVPLTGGDIGSAFNLLSELPHLPGPQLLGQGDLDALLGVISAPPAAHSAA